MNRAQTQNVPNHRLFFLIKIKSALFLLINYRKQSAKQYSIHFCHTTVYFTKALLYST